VPGKAPVVVVNMLKPRSVSVLIASLAALVPASVAPARVAEDHAARGSVAVAARGCGPSSLLPRHANLGRIAHITACLINRQRAAHGLRPVRANGALSRAARRHSEDMVGRAYFSHDTPQGVGVVQRIAASGYASGGHACALGENIAAATGPFSTPASIVRMWMNSPGHRANILSPIYRDAGVGVAFGYPGSPGRRGATFTQDFGRRC
jgi:uncharacterized protein YkwD